MSAMMLFRLADVSTHSRPKAAADAKLIADFAKKVSTHSRPKAAARNAGVIPERKFVSTHSRPKAAATKQPT